MNVKVCRVLQMTRDCRLYVTVSEISGEKRRVIITHTAGKAPLGRWRRGLMDDVTTPRHTRGQSTQPPVNVDDLRRSGKLAIWPYIIRELPLSPVEALRLELRSRDRQEVATCSQTEAGARHTKGVEYFPSRLTEDGGIAGGSERTKEPQEHGPRTGSDLGVLKAKLLDVQRRERDIFGIDVDPTFVSHAASGAIVSQRQARGRKSSPDSLGSRVRRQLKAGHRLRPSSSGPSRRPPKCAHEEDASSLLRRCASDRVECPSGCGEEVRVSDLGHHQASVCALRYISCLIPGCSTLVQARLLRVHLRRDCLKSREYRILADKGKALEAEIACDACGERLLRKHLRAHLATGCQMRMVMCPNCKERVEARSLSDHQRLDCKTAKRTAALNEQVASRPTEKECPYCHEVVESSLLRTHASDECPSRIVACPNKYLGCAEEFPAAETTSHLRKHCKVQAERAERASKYMSRRQRVQCSGCGYSVVLRHLPLHHREKCPNRRVPCKHRELGCPVMLRLSAMDDHLKVDRLLDPRACLAFDSGKAYIALGEGDRKPPWTAEIWVWRPGLVEGTREKTRTALKALWDFQRARGKLAVSEQRLALLEPLLIEVATRAAKEQSEEAGQARDRLTDEMIAAATVRDDAKVDLVVALVVLSNSVASAARGVEEITSQDRLRGFDRLALGSTPWYAPAPTPWGGGLSPDEGLPDKNLVLALKRSPPPVLPVAQNQSETAVQSSEAMAEDKALPATTGNDQQQEKASGTGATDSAPFEPSRVTEDNLNVSNDGEEEGLDAMLSNIKSKQQELETAEEEASRKGEAGFWAEWVALAGPSLAGRILTLANETLPRLEEEAVALTGLAIEALLHTAGEMATEASEGATPREEDGRAAGSSSLSRKQREKNRKAAKKAKRKQKHEQTFGKNIETRIAEEVGKRGGIETLFGSGKALFQLEMGPKDRVGIKITGRKDQIFNYRCPRERWVHLAFVADSAGVFLLENGKTASRLQDITVALPMREIGGRETACQCLVQEVRFWKVKRSKEDLVEWMHEVLPGSAMNDGLLGYWTLEEGSGDYVNDVTSQRFRARKVGRGLKWAFPENMTAVEVGAPPTPSWREQNVCKVELRRGRLAMRGRLHRQVVSCPAGCDETFPKRDTKAHLAYRCSLRIVTCSMAVCTKSMPAKDLPRHLEEDCMAHSAWLRMAEAGQELQETGSCLHCGEAVKRSNLKLHEKYVCHWVREQCPNLGCSAFVPRLRRAEHERLCGAPGVARKRRRLVRARALSKYRRHWALDEA